MDEVPKAGDFVRYICAIRNEPTDDDPPYVHLQFDWLYFGESQSLGAHAACLRGAVHPSVPLAIE